MPLRALCAILAVGLFADVMRAQDAISTANSNSPSSANAPVEAFPRLDGSNSAPFLPEPTPAPTFEKQPNTSSDSNADSFPGYRFWMAPEASVDHWPWGKGKYLPIESAAFKEWQRTTRLRNLLNDYVGGKSFSGVVSKLTLDATFDGESLSGVARLKTDAVALQNGKGPDFNTPPLPDFALAVSYSDDEKKEPLDLVASYSDGLTYLPNAETRDRVFNWSLRGKADSSDATSFNFDFPSVLSAELILRVDSAMRIDATGALVFPIPQDEGEKSGDKREWRVLFNGGTATKVTIYRPATDSAAKKIGFRQSSSYKIALVGVEASSRFDFETSKGVPADVDLILDPGLSLLSLEWGSAADLRPTETTTDPDGTTRVHVRAPIDASAELGPLRATLFAPLWTGEKRLPTIRMEAPNLEWRESILRVGIQEPLALTRAVPVDAVQTRDTGRARVDTQGAAVFKLCKPDASVNLSVRRPAARPAFDSAADSYFSSNEVSSKTTLFLDLNGQDWRRVLIPIAEGWDVDSVQAAQDDSLAWSRTNDQARDLCLSFKNPPESGATRVVVSARYINPIEERALVDRFSPVDLSDVLVGAHALSIRTDSSFQAHLTSADGKLFTPRKVEPKCLFSESQLREATPLDPGAARLWIGDQTVGLYANLENVRSNYSIAASCRALVDVDSIRETWKLRCAPVAGMRVDRVVFFVMPALQRAVDEDSESAYNGYFHEDYSWSWSTANEPDRVYEATPLSREEAAAVRAPLGADAYEIKLATTRSVPFELNLFLYAPTQTDRRVPLVFFPDADAPSVEFVVEALPRVLFKTRANSLAETTAPPQTQETAATLIKAFRYDPTVVFSADADAEIVERAPKQGDESDVKNAPRPALYASNSAIPSLELFVLNNDESNGSESLSCNSLCWFQNVDSYYQMDGSVNYNATFYLENRGRSSIRIILTIPNGKRRDKFAQSLAQTPSGDEYLPDPRRDEALSNPDFFNPEYGIVDDWTYVSNGPVFRGVNAVWADGERAPWTLWRIPPAPDGSERYAVDVRLLAKKRRLRLEFDYRDEYAEPLGSGLLVRPISVECDVPVLSGVWNAWFPPQYQARRRYYANATTRPGFILRAKNLVNSALFSFRDKEEIETIADRFASRLGNDFALRFAIGEARRFENPAPTLPVPSTAENSSGAPQTEKSATRSFNGAALAPATWGDVVGAPSLVASLFAPPAAEKLNRAFDADGKKTQETPQEGLDSPFGRIKLSRVETTLLVDRYALACVGVSPATLLPTVDATEPIERANKLFEESALILLFVAPDLALVTTREALIRQFGVAFENVNGSSICRVVAAADARRLRFEIADPANRRYVRPAEWKSQRAQVSPWALPSVDRQEPFVQGWTLVSTPLGRIGEGVYIVNRYLLVACSFFGLVAYVLLIWKRSFATPRFLIGSMGVSLAVLCAARYEMEALATGAFFGAAGLFLLNFARVFASAPARKKNADDKNSLDDAKKDMKKKKRSLRALFLRGAKKNRALVPVVREPSVSEDGFVDLKNMTQEELNYVRYGSEGNPPAKGREGRVLATLLAAILMTFALLGVVANSLRAAAPNDEYREPYRVFVPTDEKNQPSGEYYWVDSAFYDKIRADLRLRPRERSWRVVDALYEGVVNYNSFSDTTTLFSLKATYLLVVDEPVVTIALPAVQLASEGGARFDKQTIPASYGEDGKEIFFELQATPGAHILELALAPPQFFETTSKLAIPILPVPSARLELDVSADAPALDSPTALGKVVRSARRFSAELGPVDSLSLVKLDSGKTSEKAELDVEQYMLMRPRAAQTDLRAELRCQAIGGKIDAVEILCDPVFSYSGFCRCDSAEIESVEAPTARNAAMRVAFKEPVAGAFILNLDFVARNFSGVGTIPLPRIAAKDARVVKNWLAVAPEADVVCTTPNASTDLIAPFLSAWGNVDSKIVAAYDLGAAPLDAPSISASPRVSPPFVDQTATVVLYPSCAVASLVANIDASSDVFFLELDAPELLEIEDISLVDELGTPLEKPEALVSEDGLSLAFASGLRGKATLKIVAKTRIAVDLETKLPLLRVKNGLASKRYLRIYCAPNVCFDWTTRPTDWTALPLSSFAELGDEPADARRVFVYQIDEGGAPLADSEEESAIPSVESQENAQDDVPTRELILQDLMAEEPPQPEEPAKEPVEPLLIPRVNAPALVGEERVFLYPSANPSSSDRERGDLWKAAYELRFKEKSGRVDRLYVVADDYFELDPLPTNSLFNVSETTNDAGTKLLVFEAKNLLPRGEKNVELLFTATYKGDPSAVVAPKFKLATSDLYEDFSEVSRYAFLATLHGKTPIEWTIRNMRKENDPRLAMERERGELVGAMSPGVRALAVNGASGRSSAEMEDVAVYSALPAVVEQAARVGSVYFERFLCEENASARLSTFSDRMKIELAKHSFYVNERRDIFGSAVFMLKSGEANRCVVVAPPGCRILEAKVNGARRLVERASDPVEYPSEELTPDADGAQEAPNDDLNQETRWIVELDQTRYVKRLEITFRAKGVKAAKATLFKTLRRSGETFDVNFLRIEDSETIRSFWICAFEDYDSEYGDARWRIAQTVRVGRDASGEIKTYEKDARPVLVGESASAIGRLGIEESAALLAAYENDASLLGEGNDDLERLRARWLDAWRENVGVSSPFAQNPQNAAFATLDDSVLDALMVINDGESVSRDRIESSFPSPNWNATRLTDVAAAYERVFNSLGRVGEKEQFPISSPTSLWTLHSGAYARALVGADDVEPLSLKITSRPRPFDFLASPYAAAIFLLMATAALIQLLDARARAKKGLRGMAHVAFVFLWAVVFFFFGWSSVAFVGALVLVVAPALWRFAVDFKRASAAPEPSEDAANSAPDAQESPSGEENVVARIFERQKSPDGTTTEALENISQYVKSELNDDSDDDVHEFID
ncbi:MAG: hypothetical protein ACI4NP_02570 [Thermoguttaceae bacterium]